MLASCLKVYTSLPLLAKVLFQSPLFARACHSVCICTYSETFAPVKRIEPQAALLAVQTRTMRSFSENKGCLSLYRTSSPENRSLETLFMRFCQSSCRAETPVPVFHALHTEQGNASQHLFDNTVTRRRRLPTSFFKGGTSSLHQKPCRVILMPIYVVPHNFSKSPDVPSGFSYIKAGPERQSRGVCLLFPEGSRSLCLTHSTLALTLDPSR